MDSSRISYSYKIFKITAYTSMSISMPMSMSIQYICMRVARHSMNLSLDLNEYCWKYLLRDIYKMKRNETIYIFTLIGSSLWLFARGCNFVLQNPESKTSAELNHHQKWNVNMSHHTHIKCRCRKMFNKLEICVRLCGVEYGSECGGSESTINGMNRETEADRGWGNTNILYDISLNVYTVHCTLCCAYMRSSFFICFMFHMMAHFMQTVNILQFSVFS